jgi:hypothetical protein
MSHGSGVPRRAPFARDTPLEVQRTSGPKCSGTCVTGRPEPGDMAARSVRLASGGHGSDCRFRGGAGASLRDVEGCRSTPRKSRKARPGKGGFRVFRKDSHVGDLVRSAGWHTRETERDDRWTRPGKGPQVGGVTDWRREGSAAGWETTEASGGGDDPSTDTWLGALVARRRHGHEHHATTRGDDDRHGWF